MRCGCPMELRIRRNIFPRLGVKKEHIFSRDNQCRRKYGSDLSIHTLFLISAILRSTASLILMLVLSDSNARTD